MVRRIVWGDEVKSVRNQKKKREKCGCVGVSPNVRTSAKLRAIQASGISISKLLKEWWLSLEVSNRS